MRRHYEVNLATIIPVLGRPQNVEPLIESFIESKTPGWLVFVHQLDDIDETLEIHRNQHENRHLFVRNIPVVDATTWPQKINVAVEEINANWYLCGADDIRFHRGWWQATLIARQNTQIGVIGTNDLGNPRVIAGEHTCHPLIRREYILQHGTWDQPGKAIHEGYRHWYCDDELVITAKMRGAWQHCPDAIIEHLHPYWTGQPSDPTYQLGESHAETDRETFQKRMELLGVELI
jgi:hypothetical protein